MNTRKQCKGKEREKSNARETVEKEKQIRENRRQIL